MFLLAWPSTRAKIKTFGRHKKATGVSTGANPFGSIRIGGDTKSHLETTGSKPKKLHMRQGLMGTGVDHPIGISLAGLIQELASPGGIVLLVLDLH